MKFRRLVSHLVVRRIALPLAAIGFVCLMTSTAMAADDSGKGQIADSKLIMIWAIPAVAALIALVQALFFFKKMMAADEGTPKMIEIAQHVRTGANAYLMQQYKVVGLFFVGLFILLMVGAQVLNVLSPWVPFALMTGGFLSGLAGWFGMKTATWASSRTAAGAEKSLNAGLQVAFRSGAVMGLTVVGLGLLDISIWFAVLYWGFGLTTPSDISVTMLCFGIGASSQALFARVGGGIFTKAADVGADLVGKVEHGIPEDDPRNPATIADNVGDNVGDVAGMGADLYESYYGSILASAALGVAAFAGDTWAVQIQAMMLPMTIAGVGILLSIIGIYLVRTQDDATQKNLLGAIARGINASTILVMISVVGLTMWLLRDAVIAPKMLVGNFEIPGVALSIIVGLVAGWLIGKWTEYVTSDEFKPTRNLAAQAETGPATIIIGGLADGMLSTWVPVVVIGAATLSAFGFANGWNYDDPQLFALGLYGVGIAAVGMLSTLGITLATDAYGPIADNAGGNAQMAGLDPIVRQRTDALDSLGNTTAATGKGFAIGSAALTALALLAAYMEEVKVGFDRWAVSTAEQMETEGFYQLSPKYFVYSDGELDLEKTDEIGNHLHGFLALREQVGQKEVKEKLEENNFRAGPVKLDGLLELVSGKQDVARFTALPTSLAELKPLKQATLPFLMAYYDATLMNPKVLVGIFLGAMATFVFCAMTMKAVGRAAMGMVEEVRRQFREKPGIMQGTDEPDYATPVEISTQAAQREMVLPALLGLAMPVVIGLLLGVGGVMGLLVGTLTAGFCLAVFMSNAGGAWDNAKKYIETGKHGGKGTDAHKAAVVGDTVGDPFKDTSGPSLNILIKLMSVVSVVVAGLVVRYSLLAMGIF
jgi:inorganic pyrophosphatase/K(+)-stimulated pyrophosphate-energized sodium pump